MRQSLEETLTELRQQLNSTVDLDAEQIAMLRNAVTEIEDTLDKADVNSHSIAQRMHEHSLSFSETHPVLVQTIGRIADLLSRMGI